MQITPLLIVHNGLRCGSAQFKLKINLGCDQAPARGESRTESAADVGIVVQIPDRCLPRPSIVKQIVRVAVSVKVSSGHQRPATGKCRSKSSSYDCWAK